MAKIGSLVADLRLETAAFHANMKKATADLNSNVAIMKRSMSSIQGAANLVQGAIAAWAGSQVVGAVLQTVKAFSEAEKAVVQLNSALQATGRFSKEAVAAIRENASAISQITVFDDDDIVAATATFAQFAKTLSGDELAKAQKAIVGLATVMKVDLNTAATQLGKTVSGASDTIGRSGLKISETKDQASRLNEVLNATAGFFQSAQGEATSTEGRMAQLNVTWGNLQETIGETILTSVNSAGAFQALSKTIQALDQWIQNNQQSIQFWIRTILQMGETAVQMGGVVINGLGAVVTGVAASISASVTNTLKAIQFLVDGAVKSINTVIRLANSIPGVRMNQLNVQVPGLQGSKNLTAMLGQTAMGFGKNAMRGMGDIFSGRSAFGNFGGGGSGFSGGGAGPAVVGGGGGGKGGKTSKHASHQKTEAEKQLDRLKQEAESLKQSMRTLWEVEAEEIAKANKLLKMHLIDQQTYNRALNDAKNKAQSAFKIDGLDDAMKTFMEPHKKFLEKFDTSLGGALSDSGFQAVQQIIENTLTPLEKYNQQVQFLNYLHENAGLPQENFNRGLKQAQADLTEATSKGHEFATAIGNITAEFGDKFFETMTSGFTGAKVSMADFVSSALMDLSKLIFKLTVTIPLANALTNALGGNKGGGSGAAVSAGSNILGSLIKGAPIQVTSAAVG